jgi:hypothetical protein
MKKLLFPTALFGLFFAASWFTACQKDTLNGVTPDQTYQTTDLANNGTPATDLQVTDRGNANSKVFPPSAHPYGMSYTEWTEIWLQQFMSYDCATVPWVHPENTLFYSNGPVYILAGIAEPNGSVNITVPHGKALLFPMVNFWWDLCPGELPPGMTPEEYLIPNVETLLTYIDVNSLHVTIDGDAVSNLPSYKFLTGVFDFTGNIELAGCLDPCVTGSSQPVVMGGYYIMLKPLSKGQHTVHYHMEIPIWDAVQDGTYNITVQ